MRGRSRTAARALARSWTLVLAALALALAARHANASAPAIFTRVDPRAAAAVPEGTAPRALVRVDPDAVREFRARGGGALDVPLETGDVLELTLRPFELLKPGATVTSSDERGAHPMPLDLGLFRGEVTGEPGSWVVLSLGPDGALGVIESARGRWSLGPLRVAGAATSGATLHAVERSPAPSGTPRFECAADDFETPGSDRGAFPEITPAPLPLAAETRLQCDLAIDCDWEFYSVKHGGNLSQATAYVLTVMGIVSTIYERDVNVQIAIPYLNVWVGAADPYTATTTSAQLPEFANWWNANRSGVTRDLAHLVSGRSLGGGIAYLGVLCNLASAYAVSAVDGSYQYPSAFATWDAYVLAHEIGHNFNSRHTQSCFWQSNGFAPAGALLDSCYTAEGTCYSGPTGVLPPDKGTIMSYCHQVAGVANGVRLDFHTACKSVMRSHAATCLAPAAIQPPGDVVVSVVGGIASLTWTASPTPGVIRYDVYRTAIPLDPVPPLVGATTGTSFVEPNLMGTWTWKLRAVRAADQSSFSGERTLDVCSTAPRMMVAGTMPVGMTSGDFNEDGIADLAVADAIGDLLVLRGLGGGGVGNGRFAAAVSFPLDAAPSAILSRDFDEDGIADLAIADNRAPGAVLILRGLGSGGVGNGSFAAAVSFPVAAEPVAMVAGDFDEDGITDLAAACRGSDAISILRGLGSNGTGTGAFAAPVNIGPVGMQPSSLVTGDFDEDGVTDLAAVCVGDGSVARLRGLGGAGVGNGAFAILPALAVGAGAAAIVTGDFDEDGITDLAVTRNAGTATVVVFRGQGSSGVGDGSFGPANAYAAGEVAGPVVVGDFNGNGVADLAVASAGAAATVSMVLGRGDGTFVPGQPVRAIEVVGAMTSGDFLEDGIPDLAAGSWAGFFTGAVLPGGCGAAVAATVLVTSPNGGEVWPIGAQRSITWDRGDGVIAVHVEVSRDDGANWERIASDVTGTSLAWTVTPPANATAHARVRVFDASVPGRVDASNASFRIAAAPLAVMAQPPAALALGSVVPHPARGAFRVALTLPRDEAAHLELIDVAGRRVLERSVVGAGDHLVALGERERLPGGVYVLLLRQGNEKVARRVAIVR